MFTALGRFTVRHRRAVLAATVVGLVLAAVLGAGVFSRLRNGGFNDPASESAQAANLLEERFGTGAPNAVLVVTANSGSVDDNSSAVAGQQLTGLVASLEITDDTASYWSLGSPPPLASDDKTKALILTRFPGDEDDRIDALEELTEVIAEFEGPLTVEIAGAAATFREIGETIEGDLARAESIAVPITLVLLIIVFGGLVAALLPVAVGGIAVFGAFLVLYMVTAMTDVSIFSINLVTAMGLGLAIDYSLFVVSRFREELADGFDVETSVVRTVETAGRTVAFSAVTVAVSLAALLIFPLFFLRSFAYAGVGVVLVAMLTSIVSLPALLAVLGRRVDSGRILGRRAPRAPRAGLGFWGRSATAVMKRPVPVAVVVIGALIAVGLPFLRVQFGVPDHRVLPEGNDVRIVAEELRTDFSSNESDAFPVVLVGNVSPTAVEDYAIAVSQLDGVGRVDSAAGRYLGGAQAAPSDPSLAPMLGTDAAWISVVPTVEPVSLEAEDLVAEVRALIPASGIDAYVGGVSAELVDAKDAIFGLVPLAGILIAVSTFVLLFLMFGSLLVPLKAIVLNLLSLTATFGLMVWVFQDGNGSELLGFTATGLTDTTTPILMFCIAFGLSMDYEVFLLSRVKEEYDRSGDNDAAVVAGLDKTGRIVTAAAVLLSVTFFAFATSGITFIKLFGLGLGVAVLADAFVVRATLVPALMKLAGSANWWAPAPLRRVYERFGIEEGQAVTTHYRERIDVPDDARSLADPPTDGDDRTSDTLTV